MTNDTMTKEFPMPNAQPMLMEQVSRRSCGRQHWSLGYWSFFGHWVIGHWSFAFLLAMLAFNAAAGVTEPATVFYGKVVNRTSGQEYLMSEGALTWVIVKPDGTQIALSANLQPLNNGQFSYRLSVP